MTVPMWRVHELMRQQRFERQFTGRPLQAGDYIQAHVGGDIRVMERTAYSAGDCLEARAELAALAQRKERTGPEF